MKVIGFCMLLCFVGVVFIPFNSFGGVGDRSILASSRKMVDGNTMTTTARSRNLKENRYNFNFHQENSNGDVNLEDYRPVDPSPSRSKASVKHGPIQHGTPSIYIPGPKPSPPSPTPNP